MRSIDSSHEHEQGPEDPTTEHAEPGRLPRRISRKATGSSAPSMIAQPATSWSFADAVNAGIHGPIARAADAGVVSAGAETAVASAATSSGSALPAALQRKFEASLGADLSGVRVHTGESSERAAGAVAARAYAMGQDIHFGAGQYDPSSAAGEHLIAHEVAHTVQQRGGVARAQFKLEVTGAGDACEHEADTAADAMVSGSAFAVGGAGAAVARDPALTPDQERVLHLVQAQGVRLGASDQETIVGYANTLQAALTQQQGPMRRTIARALVTLYDAMEANLARRFEEGEDTGIAGEITPFSMIDLWTIEAGAPRRARQARPQRARRPAPAPDTGGGAETDPETADSGSTPAPPAETQAEMPQEVTVREDDGWHGDATGQMSHGSDGAQVIRTGMERARTMGNSEFPHGAGDARVAGTRALELMFGYREQMSSYLRMPNMPHNFREDLTSDMLMTSSTHSAYGEWQRGAELARQTWNGMTEQQRRAVRTSPYRGQALGAMSDLYGAETVRRNH